MIGILNPVKKSCKSITLIEKHKDTTNIGNNNKLTKLFEKNLLTPQLQNDWLYAKIYFTKYFK